MLTLPADVTCKANAPEEEATLNRSKVGLVDVPWTNKVETLVVVPMATEPLGLTVKMEMPVEELTWKGFKVVVPCTNKDTVADEALTPATVPLSMDTPEDLSLIHI